MIEPCPVITEKKKLPKFGNFFFLGGLGMEAEAGDGYHIGEIDVSTSYHTFLTLKYHKEYIDNS